MRIRGKNVTYSMHLLDKSRDGIVLVVRELPDRFKVITIGGKYEKIYEM